MGFFSWKCAKSGLPVLNSTSCGNPDWITVVLKNDVGLELEGEYDGYGRIDTKSGIIDLNETRISEELDNGSAKWVLKMYHDESLDYDTLGKAEYDPTQGHFISDESYEALVNLYNKTGEYITDDVIMRVSQEVENRELVEDLSSVILNTRDFCGNERDACKDHCADEGVILTDELFNQALKEADEVWNKSKQDAKASGSDDIESVTVQMPNSALCNLELSKEEVTKVELVSKKGNSINLLENSNQLESFCKFMASSGSNQLSDEQQEKFFSAVKKQGLLKIDQGITR
jgi:hypothetical protein